MCVCVFGHAHVCVCGEFATPPEPPRGGEGEKREREMREEKRRSSMRRGEAEGGEGGRTEERRRDGRRPELFQEHLTSVL